MIKQSSMNVVYIVIIFVIMGMGFIIRDKEYSKLRDRVEKLESKIVLLEEK